MSDIASGIGSIVEILKGLDSKQSTAVSIRNLTSQPLVLVDESDHHSSGDFVTLPPEEIPAGQEGVFGSGDTGILRGDVGHVTYGIGAGGADRVRFDWSNPQAGDNTATARVIGPNAARFNGRARVPANGSVAIDCEFSLREEGVTQPTPGGGGTAGADRQATALITVHNQSNSVLMLADQGHQHGGFMTFPAARIEPGESSTFASVETEGAPQEGSQGFVVFSAGAPGTCTWTVQWNNPERADNTTTMNLVGPEAPLYQTVDQVGQGDENVPVVFTIFGGPQEPVPPVPPPIDPIDPIDPVPPVPPPVEPFIAPVEQDEPTLRFGDDNPDGWVEYLQQMLNTLGFGPVPEDGNFDQTTLGAVRQLQQRRRLLVDGVVGNQTWASIREEADRSPSTDGREPHTFVEGGQEARWFTEDHAVQYDANEDVIFLLAHSTGTDPIGFDQAFARVFIGLPAGGTVDVNVPGDPESGDAAGPGQRLIFRIGAVRETHGPGSYAVQGFLPQQLGGDQTAGTVEVT